jgi:alpha-galactosidase
MKILIGLFILLWSVILAIGDNSLFLQASRGAEGTQLKWTVCGASGQQLYDVFRANSPTGTWQKVCGLTNETSIILPNTNTTTFYRVSWQKDLAAPWPQFDQISRLPPMGFNFWYNFGSIATQTHFSNQLQDFKVNGWVSLGYNLMELDDGWQSRSRQPNGDLLPDPVKFPDITNLVAFCHSIGMLAEIYTEIGPGTSAGFPGSSMEYLAQDVTNFVKWGFDIIRIDYAGLTPWSQRISELRYVRSVITAMTNKPVLLKTKGGVWTENNFDELFSVANIVVPPRDWEGIGVGPRWTNFLAHFDLIAPVRGYSGYGHWWQNMETPLGIYSDDNTVTCRSMSFMNSMLNAAHVFPQILPYGEHMLGVTNRDLLSVMQDTMCRPGNPICTTNNTNAAQMSIWVKPLVNNAKAVAFMNRSTNQTFTASATWKDLGLEAGQTYRVRDAINMVSLPDATGSITCSVAPCTCVGLILKPANITP